MKFNGRIEGGRIVLKASIDSPEGATVLVELVPEHETTTLHPEITHFTGIIPPEATAQSGYRSGIHAKY